ncbi:MAG TPA: VanZ family protein [Nitrospiria bacterium]|nr:VanZ family protein [Nitrospiria bacterium]
MLKPLSSWIVVILYAALIFYLSSGPITADVPGSDKMYHMIEYGIFSLLLYNALSSSFKKERPWKIVLLAIILTILYGISDEFHQLFVPSRSSDPYDVVADASGAIIVQGMISIRKRFFT